MKHSEETIELIKMAKQTNNMPVLMFAVNNLQKQSFEIYGKTKSKEEIMKIFHNSIKAMTFTGGNKYLTFKRYMDNWKTVKKITKNT